MTTLYNALEEPIKAASFDFTIGLPSQADANIFKTTPTLAAGDVTISIDGGNFVNITSLPTQIETTGILEVALTAAEMDGNRIVILFNDAAGAEWQDVLVEIFTKVGVQVASLGAGSIAETFTVTVDSVPKDGVDVWITTDEAGANVIARGTTDDNGEVTFMLDVGSYYWWKQLAGYTFTNPETVTVTA